MKKLMMVLGAGCVGLRLLLAQSVLGAGMARAELVDSSFDLREPLRVLEESSTPSVEQSSTTVDILVAFDRNAASYAKQHEGGVFNFANVAVAKMNTVLANNGIDADFRFRLVGTMEVDAEAMDVQVALEAIRDSEAGWAAIKAKRDEVGGDIVTTLIDTGYAYGATGAAWMLQDVQDVASFAESAYNVCAIRAVEIDHTMTREVGRNMGARDAEHDDVWTLQSTCAAVSKWREQKVPLTYDVFFSPEADTLFDETVVVTLTPGKAGLDILYTTDGSEPTLTSEHYSGPLFLKETTTVKAAAVYGGCLGPISTARYLKRDFATALNAPQLVWTTCSDSPWVAQTEYAFDGFAAQSCPAFTNNVGCGNTSWLKATVTGPTELGFRYQKKQYVGEFSVYCDGQVAWSDKEEGSEVGGAVWRRAMVSLPEGTHEIKFSFEQGWGYYPGFNGIVLDTVCFDAWSASPAIEPMTTDNQATATIFTGSMTVTLTPPAGRKGTLLYTLDGSDPTLDGALMYTGPFTIDRSVFVQAVFVEPGREASVPAQGYFLERHPVKPGEWTTDVEGVKAAVSRNDRLIAVLMAHRADCDWTKALMPVAESPEFLSWAEANGVYLITADSSQLVDTKAASDYFWSLYPYTSVGYPTLAFADPSAPDDLLAYGLARNDGVSTVGGVLYEDTVESLVRGFAAVMGETLFVEVKVGGNLNLSAAWTSGDGTETNAVEGASFKVKPGTERVKVLFTANDGYEIVGDAVVELGTVTENIVFGAEGGYMVPEVAITDPCLIAFGRGSSNMTVVWTRGDGSVTNVVPGNIKGMYVPRGSENVRIICTANPGYELIDESVFDLGTVMEDIVFGQGNDYVFPVAYNSVADVLYYNWNEESGQMTIEAARGSRKEWTAVSESTRSLKGCMVVTNDVTIPIAQIVGDAVLVLCNDATLTVTGTGDAAGIHVPTNTSLTITVRKGSTGRVVAQGGTNCAGIGSQFNQVVGSVLGAVRIVAGTVTATGGKNAAGIGNGSYGKGGSVKIFGGAVTAVGGYGAASDIGDGGNPYSSCAVAISGGVFARELDDNWLASGYTMVANEDETTKAAYPWTVADRRLRVSLDSPAGPYATATEATTAMAAAVFAMSEEVSDVLADGAARRRYYGWFGLGVTSKDASEWYVEAVLTDAAKTRLAETATKATRQIPVAEIAAQTEEGTTTVTVEGCEPGFYYTLYGAEDLGLVTPRREGASGTVNAYGPGLCGADGKVTFGAVEKPSEAAGFFTIGVSATRGKLLATWLDPASTPGCTITRLDVGEKIISGAIAISPEKGEIGRLGDRLRVTLMGCKTADGKFEDVSALLVTPEGLFVTERPEGFSLFRVRIEIIEVVE